MPLALRRAIGCLFIPYSGESYTLDIDGMRYSGRLDNYIEWVAFVTGQFYEFTYLNLIRGFGLGGCALDVGANVGNHTVAFAGMFDEVLAFEPYAPVHARLAEKVAGLPNVQVFDVGLGTADADARFAPPDGSNLGKGSVREDGGISVHIAHGDRFIEGRHTHDIRFIKVDVEGYEREVLQGLASTIARDRPVVMYEAHRLAGDCFELFPDGYAFSGLRGQTTFPVQRSVARTVPLDPARPSGRIAYVIATPAEL